MQPVLVIGRSLITGLLSLILPVCSYADQQAEKQLVDLLQPARTLQATFIQESRDSANTLLQTQTGDFKVKSNGEFIWRISAPYEQIIISDAKSLTIYDPDLEQVTIKPLDRTATVVPLLLFSGESKNIGKYYSVVSPAVNTFELLPKNKKGLFDKLSIQFSDGRPVSLLILDSLKQTTRVSFDTVVTNQQMDSSLFRFETPPGVDVIDER